MSSRLGPITNWPERAGAVGWNVARLAEKCGVCERTLELHFIETTGLTPHQWMSQLRQWQAIEPLLEGQESVKALALRLGYKQPSHFSREFRLFYGVAPTAARKLFTKRSDLDKEFRI